MDCFKIRSMPVLFLISVFLLAGPDAVRCVERAKEESTEVAPNRKLPQLEPGKWEPLFEMGESIYPSVVISTATLKTGLWDDDDKQHFGDRWGLIGIAVRGTGSNCPVCVEISGTNYVKPSVFNGVLPGKDTVYRVYPDLKYDYEKLLNVKQTMPEMLSFKVKVGGDACPEKTVRVQVRPVNECVHYFTDSSGNTVGTSFFFAAYVNENHPFINHILKEAVQSGKVNNFEGYSDDADNNENVMAQIKAVWSTLQERGIRYGAMPVSADDDDPYLETQYVRLLGESINYTQANCVDGSVMLASIFRKIGLNASLIAVPGHMFIAVDLDPAGKKKVYIETTDLGQSSFEEALDDGKDLYMKSKNKFDSDKEGDQEYDIIDIQSARIAGIIPIKDTSETQIVKKGNHPARVEQEDDE